jgi:DNA-binding MarR family transcriptional regulator
MTKASKGDPGIVTKYSFVWGWLHLLNHRYGTMSTGQMQVALTLILFFDLDYYPTVAELAEITGLAKSNVSRYVSREMKAGFLEEYIDKDDRRRRKLKPSKNAKSELEWHRRHVEKIHDLVEKEREAIARSRQKLNFDEMMAHMRAITAAAMSK